MWVDLLQEQCFTGFFVVVSVDFIVTNTAFGLPFVTGKNAL